VASLSCSASNPWESGSLPRPCPWQIVCFSVAINTYSASVRNSGSAIKSEHPPNWRLGSIAGWTHAHVQERLPSDEVFRVRDGSKDERLSNVRSPFAQAREINLGFGILDYRGMSPARKRSIFGPDQITSSQEWIVGACCVHHLWYRELDWRDNLSGARTEAYKFD